MNDTVKKVLLEEIGRLEDDAWRYEHFGSTEGDQLIAKARREKIADIKKFLNQKHNI